MSWTQRSEGSGYPSEGDSYFGDAWWKALVLRQNGECDPPPKAQTRDKLWVKSCYHIAPDTYNVVNLTKHYQCFVQLAYKREGYNRGPIARCNHPDCIKWQHTQAQQRVPCKHVRATCLWHVKLIRRVKRLHAGTHNGRLQQSGLSDADFD
jgi:hypothetical protein